MACKYCKSAREALLKGRIIEATKQVVQKVVEKKKPAPIKKRSGTAGNSPKK